MANHTPAQALGAQTPFAVVDVGGTLLAVMRRGQGTPLVCLHAIAHGARDFETLADKVGDVFEVIAVDWPGHGHSPHDGKAPSAEHYAGVLTKLLDTLKLEKPVLLGNSIGGAAALQVAAARGTAIGHVDDVIVPPNGSAATAILALDGDRLVSVPLPRLHLDGDRIVLGGEITALPEYCYA